MLPLKLGIASGPSGLERIDFKHVALELENASGSSGWAWNMMVWKAQRSIRSSGFERIDFWPCGLEVAIGSSGLERIDFEDWPRRSYAMFDSALL
jgi:hypothetical protein